MAGGRPPKFKALKELADKIEDYFAKCDSGRQMPNKAGLCIWLGITRETYNEYKKKPEFSDAIKGCEAMIENAWVQRLGGTSPTGAIFYLKNAFSADYRERTDITTNGKDLPSPILNVSRDDSDKEG